MKQLFPICLVAVSCARAQYADENSAIEPTGDDSAINSDESTDSGAPSPRNETPPWSNTEVENHINSALNAEWPSPVRIRSAYLGALSFGDSSCPGSSVELTNPVTAMQGCTAASGWTYQGHSTYSENGIVGQGSRADWWIAADFEIQNPSGQALIGGGGVMVNYHQRPEGGAEYTVELYGTWADESQSDWLGQGISAVLTTRATGTPSNHEVTLDGGLSFFSHSLHFRNLTLGAEGCSGAQGSVGIHDGESSWYWIDLDCDPCGELTYGTTALGEICLNTDGLSETIFDAVSQP